MPPFAQWAVFLHPTQRALVERDWTGPARVTGSAGTGKTIVALHRAVHLARAPDARVLLTTFSPPLAASLRARLDLLLEAHPARRPRLAVRALDEAAFDLFSSTFGACALPPPRTCARASPPPSPAGWGRGHSPASSRRNGTRWPMPGG